MKSLAGKVIFDAVNRCIYCGRTGVSLSLEHIVPLAIKGELLLPRSSCEDCGRTTGRFEGFCCDRMFNPIRKALNYSSRRKGKRKKRAPVSYLDRNGLVRRTELPSLEHPTGLSMPKFSSLPLRLTNGIALPETHIWRLGPSKEKIAAVTSHLDLQAVQIADVDLESFVRLVAKIAHGFAVAHFGYEGFRPFLPDLILGNARNWGELIGGELEDKPPLNSRDHLRLDIYEGPVIGCEVRLFAQYGAPTYHAAVGEPITSLKSRG